MINLVTGGGGFLGKHIVQQLIDRNERVLVYARGNYPDLEKSGATLIRGDITNLNATIAACNKVDVVYHVAAKPGIWGDRDSFYQPNVVGTENVIAACKKKRVSKLVYTSSPSVVFDNVNSQAGINENVPYPKKFLNYYSETKAIAEKMVLDANSADLSTVALRPHLIFGPGDPHLLPRLIKRAREGKLVQVGNGKNKVDLTYVEDAARAHLLAADTLDFGTAVAGSVYFISQDEPVNIWTWINELLKKLSIPLVKRKISQATARRMGKVAEKVYKTLGRADEPMMTEFLANSLAMDHYYDISRAKNDFGYTPQFTMQTALDNTLPYLKQL